MSKQNAQALLWCTVYVFLLLTLITPISILTIHFIMVPVLILYTRLGWKQFSLFYAICLAAVFALTGAFGEALILLALFFLPPAVVIGMFYKRQAPARSTITAGTLAMLSELLLVLVVSYLIGVKPMEKLHALVSNSIDTLPDVLKYSMSQAQLDAAAHYFVQLIPLFLISASLYYVVITHGIGRWLLRKTGIHVPGLPPARNWMLPKSFVWYFLIVMVADFFIRIDSNSAVSMFVWNLLPLLTLAFAVQTIGLLFFVAHAKKWNYTLPVVGIIALAVFFPLIYLYSILGVLDVLFSLRKRITGQP